MSTIIEHFRGSVHYTDEIHRCQRLLIAMFIDWKKKKPNSSVYANFATGSR